jgi:hypothetical protein
LLSKYFIPLFVPKLNSKTSLLYNPKHTYMSSWVYYKSKVSIFGQYLLKKKNIQNFSYLLLLEIIVNLKK